MIALDESLSSDSGRRAEVEKLYLEAGDSVCSYLYYLGVPANQVREVTNEVFLRLHQSIKSGTVIDHPRAWLFRVAHNLGLQVRQREQPFRTAERDLEHLAARSESAEAALIARERHSQIAAALETLSPQQRHCLYLRAEGLRYREIAEVTGITISSVNEFLRRAIKRLAEAAHA